MSTGPVAERIEQIRLHALREQRGELACDHARTHREELLGYIDMLTRGLEDRTDEYNTLSGKYEQQLELCADHSMEIVGLQVAVSDEDAIGVASAAVAAGDYLAGGRHAMSKFQIGDRVRILASGETKGALGTVTKATRYTASVLPDGEECALLFGDSALELVQRVLVVWLPPEVAW